VVNVLVKVEERHDNQFDVSGGGGYSTDTRAFLEAGFGVQNIFGTGIRLATRGVLGQEELSAQGKLSIPRWILRRATTVPFFVELGVLGEQKESERFGTLTSLGGNIAASKEGTRGFWEGWLLSLRYDFRLRNRDEDLIRGAGASDGIVRSKVATRSSWVGPLLAIDKRHDEEGRHNPLTPSGGFRLEARALFGEDLLLGTDRFVKLGGSGQYFRKLSDRFLIYSGVRYDHGIPLGGDSVLPEVERFFAGGDTTVRGFEEDRLATEVIEAELSPLGGVDQFLVRPAGGNIRFIHNLELQVRVWDKPPFGALSFPVASAIFLDTGLVTNSLDGIRVGDLRHSIGIALFRLLTPLASISIEYAIPLDPELGDDPAGRPHVNFGVLF
jgi:outer membrane protein assembly factor BamA